ncbi:MAG TPA: hypothetical protein EYM99_09965 [Alphaproteobacteria bacterium]|jgi:hypothetical protein|nr:hypothetical protein [Alphaproteobacteria bacterium]
MKILLPLKVLICSLLFFAVPASACSALDAAHIGKVLSVDEIARSVTIQDAETGDPITFTLDDTVSMEHKVLLNAEFDILLKLDIQSEGPTILVQFRQNEFDELLATEIERLNY